MGDLGRRLTEHDKRTLPLGTVAVLVHTGLRLGSPLSVSGSPPWQEGDACVREECTSTRHGTVKGWRNLRLGVWSNWPAMDRFALLEDKADD